MLRDVNKMISESKWFRPVRAGKGVKMSIDTKRIIILGVIALAAFVLGRLAVRAFMNLLLGGTLFGGNFL